MDDGSSLLLINIIQLTVLIVGLMAAGKLVLNSNKMTAQIGSGFRNIAKQFGAEKGLDAIRNKTGSTAKTGRRDGNESVFV